MNFKLLTQMAFALLCTGSFVAPMVAMQPLDDEERQIVAPALKPTIYYSKYFPLTLAAYAATGYAFYKFDGELSWELDCLLLLPVASISFVAEKVKKFHIQKAVNQAVNQNRFDLINRLRFFEKGYMKLSSNLGWLEGAYMAFNTIKASDEKIPLRNKLILLAGAFVTDLLLDRWATKEENIPQQDE